jgi:hypothetical protein
MHGWVLSWVQAMDVMLKFESLCATGFRGKNSISINSWNSFNLPNTLISPYTWNSLCMCVSLSKLWVWRRLEGMGSMEKWEIDPEIAEIRFSSVTTRSGVWNSPWRAWQQNLRCPARTCGALRELAVCCGSLLSPAGACCLPLAECCQHTARCCQSAARCCPSLWNPLPSMVSISLPSLITTTVSVTWH